MTNPTNTDNLIDSRDVIKRIEELQEEIQREISSQFADKAREYEQEKLEMRQELQAHFEDHCGELHEASPLALTEAEFIEHEGLTLDAWLDDVMEDPAHPQNGLATRCQACSDDIDELEEPEPDLDDTDVVTGLMLEPDLTLIHSEAQELLDLLLLQGDAEPYSRDWRSGTTLIHEDYFIKYTQQFAEDTGAVNSDAPWPTNCIDWEAAADEIRHDFSEVDFAGVPYLVRN